MAKRIIIAQKSDIIWI